MITSPVMIAEFLMVNILRKGKVNLCVFLIFYYMITHITGIPFVLKKQQWRRRSQEEYGNASLQ